MNWFQTLEKISNFFYFFSIGISEFFFKCPIGNTVAFIDYMVSVGAVQLCHSSEKAVYNNKYTLYSDQTLYRGNYSWLAGCHSSILMKHAGED